MAEKQLFLPAEDTLRVRKDVAQTAQDALAKLKSELNRFGRKTDRRGRATIVPVTESWVKNFARIADQVRRDYRLDGELPIEQAASADLQPVTESVDPLAGLKIVAEDDVA